MIAQALETPATAPAEQQAACPNCGQKDVCLFYEVRQVPVHSVLLMPTRDVAINFPKRDIQLGLCRACGFIFNTVFDPSVHLYSPDYEETQGYSGTFRKFHERLAQSLIDQFDLHGKDIIEIGCGKGEFLALLCQLGKNRGVGFDPAFVAERNPIKDRADVQFVTDFYSEKYAAVKGDFICCKMTLEHIANTAQFVETVRASVGNRQDCTVFFQVPNMRYVLSDLAFWDVYYEHCSYFTAESLTFLFENSGFDVLGTSTEYDDQYLTITARPGEWKRVPAAREFVARLEAESSRFTQQVHDLITRWHKDLQTLKDQKQKVVVWGSGSKGVAFLAAVDAASSIEYVVDINPHRQGKYMAGTGQEIVGPNFLQAYRPDVVIVMNPIYKAEIQAELDRMSLSAELRTV